MANESYFSEIVDKKPVTRKNIVINAYLVPLFSDELRKSQFEYMKRAEIDIISHIYPDEKWDAGKHTADRYFDIMKYASDYGIGVYTREVRIQESLKYTDNEIAAIANDYKCVDGNVGFYVTDEPYNPNQYAHIENALRSVIPDCFVNINFLPRECYPEGTYYKRLSDFGSLITSGGTLSLDTYNFDLDGGVNEFSLFNNYNELRRAALATNMNTSVYVQSVGYVNYRRPSEGDLRYNMMAALAYGVKEIKFFTWGRPWGEDVGYTDAIFDENHEPTDLYDAVCDINRKIHKIGSYIACGDAVAVYHTIYKTPGAYDIVPDSFPVKSIGTTDAILSVIKSRENDGQYLMVVNKDFKNSQTICLKTENIDIMIVDDKTGKLTEAPYSDGVLKFNLIAGDAALFKVEGKKLYEEKKCACRNLAVNAKLFSTSAAGDGMSFLCDIHDGKNDDGNGAKLITKDGQAQYITFDLESVKTVNRVDIYPAGRGIQCGYNYPLGLCILVSENGSDWTCVIKEDDYKLDRCKVPVFRFKSSKAKYVRIAVTKFAVTNGNGSCQFGEVEIYNDDGTIPSDIKTSYDESLYRYKEGENIALNRPVYSYSSSVDEPGWGCHHNFINDGEHDKVWAGALSRHTAPENQEWIIIDLMENYDVEKVVLVPQKILNGVNVFPSDYEIQLSEDAENWITVKKVEGDNVPVSQDTRELAFEPRKAQFVKLLATKLTRSSQPEGVFYGIEIAEMEIYGKPSEE